MQIGLDNYKFGKKNNWRRWQWNQIANRLKEIGKPIKEAVILYLCGPEDIDRKIAIEKGFKENNLIAIDYNNNNIGKIRLGKNLGICGDLNHVLINWILNLTVDVIIADFCCGINKSTMKFGWLLCHTHAISPKSVVSINLLRGRDKEFTKLKEAYLSEYGFLPFGKNRAKHLYNLIIDTYINIIMNNKDTGCPQEITKDELINLCSRNKNLTKERMDMVWFGFNPIFNTYKSDNKKTTMDSVIFNFERIYDYRSKFFLREKSITAQIAAIKAHRTMRMNAA